MFDPKTHPEEDKAYKVAQKHAPQFQKEYMEQKYKNASSPEGWKKNLEEQDEHIRNIK